MSIIYVLQLKCFAFLHAVLIVFFGNVYFAIVNFNIRGRNKQFSESSQNFMSEKSIFGHFEVTFLNILNFSRSGIVFSC